MPCVVCCALSVVRCAKCVSFMCLKHMFMCCMGLSSGLSKHVRALCGKCLIRRCKDFHDLSGTVLRARQACSSIVFGNALRAKQPGA